MANIGDQGYDANENGFPRDSNPYVIGSNVASEWYEGWDLMELVRQVPDGIS